MNAPLISILIPAKNAAKYIESTIASIINQTYISWELIIINDHSTDDTLDLLNPFLEDQRISVSNNLGVGIISALAQAFEQSVGAFITRMDADDIMPPNKLQCLFDALQVNPTTRVATGLVKYFRDDMPVKDGYLNYELWMNSNLMSENPFDDMFKECVIPSPAWMVHRSVIEKIEGFKQLQYPEDYDLAFHFWQMNLKIAVVPQIIHLWRDHTERASRTDDHYAENTFLPLKLSWLIRMKPNIHFNLIGAGKKGKKIAQYLIKERVSFDWFTNNIKKLQVPIYDKPLKALEITSTDLKECWLVAVANREEQQAIENEFAAKKMKKGTHYLLFC